MQKPRQGVYMDYETDWTATALFSPSKARQQQAQAKDWSFVDAWLARRYDSKPTPAFERNEGTLQALLALATLNESADEQRTLVGRVHSVALKTLREKSSSAKHQIQEALLQSLCDTDTEALQALADATITLNSPSASTAALAECTIALTSRSFDLSQQLQGADHLCQTLEAEQKRLSSLVDQICDDSFQAPSKLPQQTVEWQRGVKHLKAKIAEYNERLSAMSSAHVSRISVEDVGDEEARLGDLERRLAELDGSIAIYQGLPADPKAAKKRLDDARSELLGALRKRDQLFEQLVDKS